MSQGRLLAASLILLVGFFQACSRPQAPQDSCAFVQNLEMQRVSWKGQYPIKLYVHQSVPTEAYPAIDRAVSEYNEKVGHGVEMFKVVARGVAGDLNPTKDGYSMIYWFNTWDPARPTEQARTTIYWTGNQIFEADMRINAANFSYSYEQQPAGGQVDLDSLVVHELGHVLGLAHNASTGSVMAITLNEGVERRALGAVDEHNLSCEY